MEPAPIFCEGAAKTHFGWHMLSGGNAFDVSPANTFREMIRLHPAAEAERLAQDFTRVNFGWWGIFDLDLQPDHWEYGNSLAAAWDCPATYQALLPYMQQHPRLDDFLEVMRRWEEVRISGWLTDDQKQEIISDQQQEHILLINEHQEYELQPYAQIATTDEKLRAFAFQRGKRSYIVYWHTQGNAMLKLPFPVTLQDELHAPSQETNLLPVGHRRYISSELPIGMLQEAFETAMLSTEV
jgi:hypothetical protein